MSAASIFCQALAFKNGEETPSLEKVVSTTHLYSILWQSQERGEAQGKMVALGSWEWWSLNIGIPGFGNDSLAQQK